MCKAPFKVPAKDGAQAVQTLQPRVVWIGHEDVGALVHALAHAPVRKVPHPLLLSNTQGLCQFAHDRKAY